MSVVIRERAGRIELVDGQSAGLAREELLDPSVIDSDDRRTTRRHDVDGLVRVRTAHLGVRIPKLLGPDAFDWNLEVTLTQRSDGVAHGH